MSKGISRQQRRILGLAVALARRRHPRGKLIAADPTDAPDITVALAAVVVGGVALVTRVRPTGAFRREVVCQDRSPAGLSARASIDHAFGSLARRGLLAPCEPRRFNRTSGHNPNHEGRYILTEAGIAAGLAHEEPITAAMRPILWLLRESTRGTALMGRSALVYDPG
jgi:hypothetical protein